MKNTKYQKIIIVAILGILIYPSIVMASWWNPLSWFNSWKFSNKEEIKIEQNIIIPTTNINKSDEVIKEKVDIVTQPTKKNGPKKNIDPVVNKTPTIQVNPPVKTITEQTSPSSSDIDSLKDTIKNLENKVQSLESKNNEVQEWIDNSAKLKPQITLDKTIIENNGSDRIKITIKTINSDGKIVPNKEIEIITYLSDSESNKTIKKITSDDNGNATYYTPTTTAYNRCGVSMDINIKIDDESVFEQFIGIKNVQEVPKSGGACA
jgi:hypothetical protein